jgi:hypothetical protein
LCLFIALCWMVTKWSSLDTCQLQNLLRWINMQADLDMLNWMNHNFTLPKLNTCIICLVTSFDH